MVRIRCDNQMGCPQEKPLGKKLEVDAGGQGE